LKSAHSKGDNGQGVVFVSSEYEKFGGCSEMAIPMRDLSKSDALSMCFPDYVSSPDPVYRNAVVFALRLSP
jgi:hypothetical protein